MIVDTAAQPCYNNIIAKTVHNNLRIWLTTLAAKNHWSYRELFDKPNTCQNYFNLGRERIMRSITADVSQRAALEMGLSIFPAICDLKSLLTHLLFSGICTGSKSSRASVPGRWPVLHLSSSRDGYSWCIGTREYPGNVMSGQKQRRFAIVVSRFNCPVLRSLGLLRLRLRVAGNANGSSLNNQGSNANWWSSTVNSATNAYNLNLNSSNIYPQNTNNKYNGFSVRCIQDTCQSVCRPYLAHSGATYLVSRCLVSNNYSQNFIYNYSVFHQGLS